MELKVVSGKTILLPAEFFSGDEPTDPATPRVQIADPKGAVLVSNGVPVRDRKGVYRFNYPVPAAGPVGTWKATWSATIDGARVSATDLFEVQPAAPPVPPAGTAEAKPPTGPPEAAGAPATRPAESQPAAAPQATPKPGAPAPPKTDNEPEPDDKAKKPEPAGPKLEDKWSGNRAGGVPGRNRKPGSGEPRSRLSRGKALLIIGALAILVATMWFSPRRQDTVQDKIDQGVAAQKAGRTDEAQKLYEEVLENDPDNKLANFNLGVAAQVAGDTQRAEELYLKSLQADPDFLPALFNLAILQERADRNDESAETYRRLLEKYPDNGPAHLNYGFLLVQKLNQPDEGRAEFTRAVEIDPGLAARIPPDLRPAPAPEP